MTPATPALCRGVLVSRGSEGFCPDFSCISVQMRGQTDRNAERIRTMAQGNAAENRHVELVEVFSDNIEHGLLACRSKPCELTDHHTGYAIKVTGLSQHGQVPIDLADCHVHGF